MDLKSKNIQLQYQGYLNTPLLWKHHEVMDLKPFEIINKPINHFNETLPDNLRLGKRVERFVSAELQQHENITILLENVQVQNQKLTLGEIDCILEWDGVPIHLEIIYKFYLYDPKVGHSEIEHWIGPNRNDNLLKKLTKLKDRQLPLIYNAYTKPILDRMHLNVDTILQRVCFKAQLFTPYHTEADFDLLNKDCLKGFYIHVSQINLFTDCKFYIPNKTDWLKEVQSHVNWMTFDVFEKEITLITNEKSAPLCWIKHPNGTLQKFFVVWWD
ncbi:MAG: DUF1853 family protein [Algibacter sp.]